MRYSICCLLLILSTVHFSTALAAVQPSAPPLPKGYLQCPLPSDLQKDPHTLQWSSPGGWQSFDTSFASQVAQFIGAQWQGVNVGHLTCLYSSTETFTFPILLRFNELTWMPRGGLWSKNLGGYTNCHSTHRHQCLFKPVPQPKVGDPYEEAKKLQRSNPNELGF
ncbi:MAG: hypothetical protein A3F41_02775 [Coxiella sp. RIFCSPHIGHO2_12_FULL_44_14]|nr:MAG: hypothetical protein A3F41_02775 [Coxiella sp. RIFCSPHIGHO2_12_FULL_44_14]